MSRSCPFSRSLQITFSVLVASLVISAAAKAQDVQLDASQLQLRTRQTLVEREPVHRLRGVHYKANVIPEGGKVHAQGAHPNVSPDCSAPRLSYFGGPVISKVQPIVVFWNSNVNAQLTSPNTGIAQFLTDVQVSTYLSVPSQYSTYGQAPNSTTSNQLIGDGAGSAVPQYTLTPSVCPATTSTSTCTVTDDEIQTELNAQIAAGNLPAPQVDSQGNDTTLYMTYFPPKVAVNYFGSLSCQVFCAYHNTGTYSGTGNPLVYGVLMDEFTTACAGGCGEDPTAMNDMTDTSSHEFAEAITDTDIGLDTGNDYAYPGGWGDNNNNCGEIADICDNGQGDTINVGGRTWFVQELWSNAANRCESVGTVTPPYGFGVSTSQTAGTPFSFSMTAELPVGGTNTNYTGTVHFTSTDPSATLPTDYTYTSADAGTHTFQATLHTSGAQTLTVTDANFTTVTTGLGFTVSQALAVLTTPTPQSTLTGSSATFSWTTGSGVTAYLMHVGTTGPGSSNIYSSGTLHTTTVNVSSIPTTGATLNVRLYSYINNAWQFNDYTYTEANIATPAVMSTPAPSSTLTGSSVGFTWTAGSEVTAYLVHVGTTGAGSSNIYSSGTLHATTATVSGIPTTGGTLNVRLYSYINNAWQYNDYTYSEASVATPAVMTTPAPNSTLSGSSATFTWTAGSEVTAYLLHVGTTGAGSANIASTGTLHTTSTTITGIPTTGGTLNVRLYSYINNAWQFNDYTYTEQ